MYFMSCLRFKLFFTWELDLSFVRVGAIFIPKASKHLTDVL